MAIVNRDLDPTQQRLVYSNAGPFYNGTSAVLNTVGTSQLINIGIVPCASQLVSVATSAFGLSGSPIIGVQVQRFVVGSGLTTIAWSTSLLTVTAFSTSGIQTQLLPASGASGFGLLKGDTIQLVTSAANTSAVYCIEAVIQILQDVKSDYGV